MQISQIGNLNASESIIFLGSGFSRDTLNLRGNKLPLGEGLREELAKLLQVDSNQYDLQTLADEANSSDKIDLYQTLYEMFTVTKLEKYHEDILKLP